MSATPLAPDLLPDGELDAQEPPDLTDHDATSLLEVHDGSSGAADNHLVDQYLTDADFNDLLDPADASARHELIIVDTSVDGFELLLEDVLGERDGSAQFEILAIDGHRDGIEQITELLADYDDLDAVHILSHGTDGALKLGSTWLNADHLAAYAGDIAQWGDALAPDGDLLLYGCDLAATADGQEFLESISVLTGADVSASIDATGHTLLGADWDLEFAIGDIDTDSLLSASVDHAWVSVLASEYVYDGFESHDYSGNSGSVNWLGDWQEVNDDGNHSSGNVHVAHYDLDGVGSHSLKINAEANVGIYRAVDLSEASSAWLNVDYQRHASSGFLGSTLEIQVFDGSSWNTVHSVNPGYDAGTESLALNLTPYMSSNTTLRLLSTASGSGSIFLDHVDLTYQVNTAPVLQSGGPLTLTAIQEDNLTSAEIP